MQTAFTRNNVAIDPSVITFKLYKDGVLLVAYIYGTDAQLVKSGTGIYYVLYDATASGYYTWQMSGTGTGNGAFNATRWDNFNINPDPSP